MAQHFLTIKVGKRIYNCSIKTKGKKEKEKPDWYDNYNKELEEQNLGIWFILKIVTANGNTMKKWKRQCDLLWKIVNGLLGLNPRSIMKKAMRFTMKIVTAFGKKGEVCEKGNVIYVKENSKGKIIDKKSKKS